MKKNITLNKYYKKLKNNIFQDLEINDFLEVYTKNKKLSIQYKLLKVCCLLEKIKIRKINVPVLRFFTMFLDFIRWKIYDIFISIINGKTFNLYGVTCFCGRQRKSEKLLELLENYKK